MNRVKYVSNKIHQFNERALYILGPFLKIMSDKLKLSYGIDNVK